MWNTGGRGLATAAPADHHPSASDVLMKTTKLELCKITTLLRIDAHDCLDGRGELGAAHAAGPVHDDAQPGIDLRCGRGGQLPDSIRVMCTPGARVRAAVRIAARKTILPCKSGEKWVRRLKSAAWG
eukprot:gene11592-biopygen3367